MKKERNATKAGFFIVFSAALIVVIVMAIKGGVSLSDPMQTRIVQFNLKDDLGGLRVGDDVRVGGYKVGAVTKIEPADLDKAEPYMEVTFTLPARYQLRTDAVVGVQSTLTGTACVNVESLGSPGKPAAAGNLVGTPDPKTLALASLAAISHEVMTGTLPKVNLAIDSFRQTGDSTTTLVRHVDEKVDPIVKKYDVVVEKAGGALDSVHEMVGPSVTDFHGTVANLHEITSDLKGKLPEMLARVDADIEGARGALDSVQKTADNTKEISASVRSLIADNRGKIDGIIASIKSAGDNLKGASVEIRHSPWRLLYQPSSGEMANLGVFDAARQFADPKKVQEMLNRLERTFVKFHDVEQKLWTDVKE
jgi:ABC-type transporter Mla subunit MlaD